ncbi:hypothetical protein Ahy_B06g084843 isoform B [Arachis hypogaea]|uniref:Mitochondrial pyruvate carrier n=2 Tax=Arachis TaxID=3817 RepID=A0A444YSW8_ARAHY|nr:hypothetical protein Ahy_B06g084843 isoform B [Arachis hypogaea]
MCLDWIQSIKGYSSLDFIGFYLLYWCVPDSRGVRIAYFHLLNNNNPALQDLKVSWKMNTLRAFWNSPIGPKTTHFWGPTFNWSLPLAAAMDTKKPPEAISVNMTAVMCIYSALFMRFAWVVRPRNLHLLACHVSNETVQLYQLSRWIRAQRGYDQKKEEAAGEE